MEKRTKFPKSTKPAVLSERVSRLLGNYATAATAAGVAALACAMPAEAAPVCKSLSVDLFHSATYPINPAEQFAAPFNVAQTSYTYFHSTTGISHFSWWNRGFFSPNSVGAKVLLGSQNLPADIASGASIGPGGNFGKGSSYGLMFTYGNGTWFDHVNGTLTKHRGNLNLQQVNFVGFEFLQDGQIHFGWARLRMSFVPEMFYTTDYALTKIHLLGFGYETTPNTAIAAGACTGNAAQNSESSNQRAPELEVKAGHLRANADTLGVLALGNLSLAIPRIRVE